jgi:hypothetical protein
MHTMPEMKRLRQRNQLVDDENSSGIRKGGLE